MPITLVSGLSTFGKSLWGKLHTRNHPRLFFHDPLTDYPDVQWVDENELIELFDSGALEKNFRVGTYNAEDYDSLNDIAFLTGNCKILTDECSVLFRRGQVLSESVRQTIFMGRHKNVDPIMMSQRAASIPIDLRSQATRVVTFKQLAPDDIRMLRNYFGDETETITEFRKFLCLDYQNGNISKYSIKEQAERYLNIKLDDDAQF